MVNQEVLSVILTCAAYPKEMKLRQLPAMKKRIPACINRLFTTEIFTRDTSCHLLKTRRIKLMLPILHVWKYTIGFIIKALPFVPSFATIEYLSLCKLDTHKISQKASGVVLFWFYIFCIHLLNKERTREDTNWKCQHKTRYFRSYRLLTCR